uniref:Uncharacterized protein n=1 Tax=Mycobacterium celatum TaxID=28045 RepID=Q93S57_MYCCE|nr:unknown [Mycobacterium celatum]
MSSKQQRPDMAPRRPSAELARRRRRVRAHRNRHGPGRRDQHADTAAA